MAQAHNSACAQRGALTDPLHIMVTKCQTQVRCNVSRWQCKRLEPLPRTDRATGCAPAGQYSPAPWDMFQPGRSTAWLRFRRCELTSSRVDSVPRDCVGQSSQSNGAASRRDDRGFDRLRRTLSVQHVRFCRSFFLGHVKVPSLPKVDSAQRMRQHYRDSFFWGRR